MRPVHVCVQYCSAPYPQQPQIILLTMGQHVWLVLAVATLLAIIVNPALSQTSANTSQLGQQLSGTAFPMGQQTRGNASHASHVLLIRWGLFNINVDITLQLFAVPCVPLQLARSIWS